MSNHLWRLASVLLVSAIPLAMVSSAQAPDGARRTVYVTAVDHRGDFVSDLTALDLTVREGGRERVIADVSPAKDRLQVAVLVDELLAPDPTVRRATFALAQRITASGDVALYLVGQQNRQMVDYTTDLSRVSTALNAFPIRAQYPGTIVQALREIAKAQRTREGRRVIVVVAPEIPQVSTVTAEAVFNELRDGGVALYAATFAGWRTRPGTLVEQQATRLEGGDLTQEVERDRVLNDGPKQSGGLRVTSTRIDDLAAALGRMAEDMLHQYRVTYELVPGTRADGRVSIGARRKGLTVRGPSRVAER